MLLFIMLMELVNHALLLVSIHLMLLFIGKGCSNFSCLYTFQYISCYSLSRTQYATLASICRFNTSHVTLYLYATPLGIVIVAFQYISCYSLSINAKFISSHKPVSIHLMLLFIVAADRFPVLVAAFQYISCYSLSSRYTKREQQELLFQYISCYSLSSLGEASTKEITGFQYISCYSLSGFPSD